MLKNKVYYAIGLSSVEPVKVIEEFPSGNINVKGLNSGNTYWISEYNIYDTEEEACKKLIRDLECANEELERDIECFQEDLEINNKIIEDLKQRI